MAQPMTHARAINHPDHDLDIPARDVRVGDELALPGPHDCAAYLRVEHIVYTIPGWVGWALEGGTPHNEHPDSIVRVLRGVVA